MTTKLANLPTASIKDRPGDNPNVLGAEQFELLVAAIKRFGFLQPVTVRVLPDGSHELIDGHHRLQAARKLALPKVPALITDADDLNAMAESLSMNRLRGEVDLGRAAAMLRDLASLGFDDLTLTGFKADEVEALLRDVGTMSGLDNLGEGAGADTGETISGTHRHAIRLLFDHESDRDAVREFLLASGATVEAGMIKIMRGK